MPDQPPAPDEPPVLPDPVANSTAHSFNPIDR